MLLETIIPQYLLSVEVVLWRSTRIILGTLIANELPKGWRLSAVIPYLRHRTI